MNHNSLQRALRQQIASYKSAGVTHVRAAAGDALADPPAGNSADAIEPTGDRLSTTLTEEPTMAQSAKSASSLLDNNAAEASIPAEQKPAVLRVLQDEVAGCTLCAELAATRTQTVFGVGNADARVVFFGEAPGADEDRLGEPFVGRAGQLLDKIIAACTWQREDVYILNTLKCRPPSNRNPEAEELANCRPYWQRQLEIIAPEFIVCLGKFAMQEILQTAPSQSIGKMRKKFHTYGNAKVMVTYHPSYLLRNPAAKKDVWEDMKLLMREMGMEV